ncbi:prenyltransferase/squalene oxidase repeat-containing protein [Amycolatopsis sp. QT-25]|uniref:prenyltransferase/squalene oxidase repeat-containing protein n=1 Tax=Amycolatopsis sp. QT-25 TaxID=3034022 RepID=UPI0023EBB87C|nr:prenyltransferase/squalene oxidase repeat-containing protein [Amycolatopsis sp. QT-25]WET80800.1 prenyltransferase/squalene oxidase repeat-containing protein [Amycolatopsis sp. QT-25]
MSDRHQMETLLKEMAANRVTQFSPSPYETGQYLRVSGRAGTTDSQVAYLLKTQRSDGLWGADGFELVPTLGAIAGLASLSDAAVRPGVADALSRACRRLWDLASSEEGLAALPDTVASELITPALIDGNREVLRRYSPAGPERDFPQPPRARPEFWRKLAGLIAAGQPIPKKLWHSLEVFHPLPSAFAGTVAAAEDGAVTCSPAATAAWVAAVGPEVGRGSLAYLDEVEGRYDGAIPMGSSMTFFELLWVLVPVLKYFPEIRVPNELITELTDAFGETGIGGGPGLPPDGDDTSYLMLAMEMRGSVTDPAVLMKFWEDDHFISYKAEQTASETVNAHAIEYLSRVRLRRGVQEYARTEDVCVDWLIAQQTTEGCWYDKWHISPYYATHACVEALLFSGKKTKTVVDSVERARTWLLRSQQEDGGWGIRKTTQEETAYAVLALDCFVSNDPGRADEAAKAITLANGVLSGQDEETPPLWMGKDLYTPYRIVDTVESCGRVVAARY